MYTFFFNIYIYNSEGCKNKKYIEYVYKYIYIYIYIYTYIAYTNIYMYTNI